jgi:hypothetical protein
MRRGWGAEFDRENSVAETVKLFLLPPLLTFALIAFSLLVFTNRLAQKELRTTFVSEGARDAGGLALRVR